LYKTSVLTPAASVTQACHRLYATHKITACGATFYGDEAFGAARRCGRCDGGGAATASNSGITPTTNLIRA